MLCTHLTSQAEKIQAQGEKLPELTKQGIFLNENIAAHLVLDLTASPLTPSAATDVLMSSLGRPTPLSDFCCFLGALVAGALGPNAA